MANYHERQVVLCKDCKWRHVDPYEDNGEDLLLGDGCRWNIDEETDDDDFCSYGEAKEDD